MRFLPTVEGRAVKHLAYSFPLLFVKSFPVILYTYNVYCLCGYYTADIEVDLAIVYKACIN